MPTPTKGPRLGSGPAHQRLMLAGLATALFEHGRITTTEAKARRLRPLAERLITKAKRGDLHARRQVMRVIRDKGVAHSLFAEIGPRYENRPGGYTRIIKIGPRKGDNAPMAVLELVEPLAEQAVAEAEGATRRAAKEATAPRARAGATEAAEPAVEEAGGESAAAAEGSEGAPESESAEAPAERAVEVVEGPYGPDSAEPLEDGSGPEGYPVKGNRNSMKYHTPDSQWYDQTVAEVWFRSAEAAEAAGFEAPGQQGGDAS